MVVTKPPMGWNSWNTFAGKIDENMIKEIADKMVSEGLLDAGYDYLVIDDCWSLPERDEDGRLVPDPKKFPNGMKALSDYIHSKGLKFGMYSCAGTLTCAARPGSYDHEFTDAATFAEWGVDFLKYDYCFRDQNVPGEILYRRMGLALANCGRDILFSACNWGVDDSDNWIKTTGAHMWRSTHDIFDNWESIKTRAQQQFNRLNTNGQGCFNDMDMLVVGLNGGGFVSNDQSTLNDADYRTHFSIWAMLGSPLMIGCDVRNMSEETKKTLANKDIIAICQDGAYRQPFFSKQRTDEIFVLARLLEDGDIAIGFFNLSERKIANWDVWFTFTEIGIGMGSGKTLKLRDLWTGEESIPANEVILPGNIEPHGCKIFRASIIDRK